MHYLKNSPQSLAVLKRLLCYFKPHQTLLWGALLSIVIFSIVDAGMIYFIKPLIDDGLAHSDGNVLKIGAVLVVVIFVIRGFASFCFNYCLAYVSNKITFTIRQQAYSQLLYLPLTYLQQHNSGKLIAKFVYDSEQISKATSEAFLVCIRESLIILVLLAVMFYSSWQLSLIFLVIGPVIALVIGKVSRRFKHISVELQKAMGEITRSCEQSITSHKEILASCTQVPEQSQFEKVNNRNRRQSMKLASASAISSPVVQIIASLAIAVVLWLASIEGVIEQISAGTFTATLVAMGSLLKPLKQITNVNQILQRGLVAAESVFQLLDESREPDNGHKRCHDFSDKIKVNNLSLSYSDDHDRALSHVNFEVRKGQKVAIVGKSGSGKTSILNALLRFYPDNISKDCEILLDGEPVDYFTLESYRRQFSLVSQQVVLFDDSITANICYGCNFEVTVEQVEAAAKAADVMQFASKLPAGLGTQIGENGNKLSGGQRQRIAIARAILRNAPILLLDEATSALDSSSESNIQSALSHLQQDKTTIVIAHRLSTILTSDEIIVMNDGEIQERGSHQSLIEKKGHYYQLYNQQFAQQDLVL